MFSDDRTLFKGAVDRWELLQGCIKIADRTKDGIKIGGKWISSVDLENALMSHDKVLEASVVGGAA